MKIAFIRLQSLVIRNLVHFRQEQGKDQGLILGKQVVDRCQLSPI